MGGVITGIDAAPLAQGSNKYISLTVGATVYTVTPPAGVYGYLRVLNTHTTGVVKVCLGEDPVDAPAATPGVAADWEAGYPVGPGQTETIPIGGTISTLRLLSDTSGTTVVLGLVS